MKNDDRNRDEREEGELDAVVHNKWVMRRLLMTATKWEKRGTAQGRAAAYIR